MTSAAITETSVNSIQPVNVTKTQTDGKTDSFSNVMSQTTKDVPTKKDAFKVNGIKSDVNTGKVISTDRSKQNQNVQDNKIQTDNKADRTQQSSDSGKIKDDKVQDNTQDVSGQLDESEVKQKVMKEIAEELDVSPEEVENAMHLLGLSVMDLMQQGNMAALTAQLTGNDLVAALTDENFFMQVGQLTELVTEDLSQIAESLGIDISQLETIMANQVEGQNPNDDQNIVEIIGDRDTVDDVQKDLQLKENSVDSESSVVQVVNESSDTEQKENVEVIVDSDSEVAGKEIQPASTTVDESGWNKQNHETDQNEQNENGTLLQQKTEISLNAQQFVNETMKAAETFTESFDSARTKEIIDQIADYVKIHNNNQISEMEIQLNPEHLGTVNLQVVSKNGTISAQLSAGDELVRAALESQVAQLRETLQAQGLKVDAVEVTIASHEFEQNLEQNLGQNSKEDMNKPGKRNSRKLLNLDEIPTDEMQEDDMTDAERLQIQMMRMGGNKLNYQV